MPVTNVTSDQTPNAGRVNWNNSDNDLQSQINTDVAALATHKTGGDHDTRYYTEAEVDAIETGLANDIAAVEAALDTHKSSGDHDARYQKLNSPVDVVVKKVAAAVELQKVDGTPVARFYGTTGPDGSQLYFQVWTGSVWSDVMYYLLGQTYVTFPNRDVYANGKKLATVDDVTNSIRSGSAYLHGQTDLIANASSGYTKVGTADQWFAIPQGKRITRIDVVPREADADVPGVLTASLNLDAQGVFVHIAGNGGAFIVSIKDRTLTTLWSATYAGSPVNTGAVYAVTLTLSV